MMYSSFRSELSHHLSKGRIFILDVAKWLPHGLLTWLSERSQDPSQVILRRNRAEAHRVAQTLIDLKREELAAGASRRDLMSLLCPLSSTRSSKGSADAIIQ